MAVWTSAVVVVTALHSSATLFYVEPMTLSPVSAEMSSPQLSKVVNFNLPHLHFAPPFGMTPFEFCRDLRHQKTRTPGLSCGVVCVILR